MPTRPYLVLANDAAGSTARAAVGMAIARLAEHAPVRLCWTEDRDHFRSVVHDDGDDHQLVIAGGDGSIHLALDVLHELERTATPVGIVPLGTGNDLARNRDIPLDPQDAADVIVAGADRWLPAIEMRCGDRLTLVANNLHFGMGATAARRAQALKPAVGRFAYPLATAFQGVAGTPDRFTVRGDDDDPVWEGDALAVLALLGPSMGGGVEIVPDAAATGLDLVVIGPADLRERVDLVGRVRSGDLADHPSVTRRWVTSCTIEGAGAGFADVDGELMELSPPVQLTHVPEAWRVIVPPA